MSEIMLNDLVKRTNGDLYIGVVGPVRMGKSTLVKKMMENIVIPNLQDEDFKLKTIDELPQSSPGPVIMTAEPKFVPAQAIPVQVEGIDVPFRIRFADCVGYIIDGAQGYEHEGKPKLVHTPWHPEPIPFIEAAKIGTNKVIKDHANIGIVVTSDGTINGFKREAVEKAEEEIVEQLVMTNKPIIIVLNCVNPYNEHTIALKHKLMAKYNVPVINCNVERLSIHEINEILREALFEFPVQKIELEKPDWVDVLPTSSFIHESIQSLWDEISEEQYKVREMDQIASNFNQLPFIEKSELYELDASNGNAVIRLMFKEESFIQACEMVSHTKFETKKDWLLFIRDAYLAKKSQERFMEAIEDAEIEGYGIAIPTIEQFEPQQPELIKQNNFFGVKMTTTAPSYHIIRVDLEAEFAPLIGSEFHSQQLLNELQKGYEHNREALWAISLFGSSLADVLLESIKYKMNNVPDSAKKRMRLTIERMVNEGEKGLITFVI